MKTILIIEDDEISRAFMAEAVALLPVKCVTCSGFAQARQLLLEIQVDLIISDINTVDGSLFENADTLPLSCKKLAVSADINPAIHARLLQIGMHEVMAKPMTIDSLHKALNRLIALDYSMPTPFWDNHKALAALGQNEYILTSLKEMFKTELPQMIAHIQQAFDTQQPEKIHDTLHKLKASCGFLGANRLLQECSRLDADISAQNIDRFMGVAKQTLALI